jgi:hypothetical protein
MKATGSEASAKTIATVNADEDPDQAMVSLMGFGGFETTKVRRVTPDLHTTTNYCSKQPSLNGFSFFQGKKVQEDSSAVNIKKQRQYRQYMNRRGGFNRYVCLVCRISLIKLSIDGCVFLSPLDKVA